LATPDTYHLAGIKRGTATSNFHAYRDNLANIAPTIILLNRILTPFTKTTPPVGDGALQHSLL